MDSSFETHSSKKEQLQLEVLTPWAEAESVPLRRISPRLKDIEGKRIGLFVNDKRAARGILQAFERQLLERVPGTSTSWYMCTEVNVPEMRTAGKQRFADWIGGVDAVVLSVGD